MTRLIDWQDSRYALQTGPMDAAHQEFVTLTNALADSADADEALCLTRLFAHCREHFAQEELWMRSSQLPTAEVHVQDHASVLALLDAALVALNAGQHGAGRDAAEKLAAWFGRHSATLDAALAFHMQQSTHSAKPAIPAVG